MPHQKGQSAFLVAWNEVLHVHLLDLVHPVGIDLGWDTARGEIYLFDGFAREVHLTPTDMKRAHVLQRQVTRRDQVGAAHQQTQSRKNARQFKFQHGWISLNFFLNQLCALKL